MERRGWLLQQPEVQVVELASGLCRRGAQAAQSSESNLLSCVAGEGKGMAQPGETGAAAAPVSLCGVRLDVVEKLTIVRSHIVNE